MRLFFRLYRKYYTVFSGFLPLGMVVFGPLADAVSMRLLMILSGVLLLLLAAAVLCDRKFYHHTQNQEIP